MFRQSKRRITLRRNDEHDEFSANSTNSTNPANNIAVGTISNKEKNAFFAKLYDAKLSFYNYPPIGEITLHEFEVWAIERLKILIEIESAIARNKSMKEIEGLIKSDLTKKLPLHTDNVEDWKKDYYSHFILRLCFCRTKELREKFVKAETCLFKIRFNMLTSADQIKFVRSLNLSVMQVITEEEKKHLGPQLYATIAPALQFQLKIIEDSQKMKYFQQERFLKLPFENVIELVGNRSVFLKDGFAYVPHFQQLNLISSEFSNMLSNEILKTFQHLPRLNEDDRLLPILHHLSSGYAVADFHQASDSNFTFGVDNFEINANNVYKEEVTKHFPLCMKNLMDALLQMGHLRYHGRQQLSLFLKGIGLNAEEGLKFWCHMFTRNGKMTEDKFNKEYRYNFRHNYGLEGNRINYKPWDYRTILSKPRPGRGDYHGCVFRDWGSEKLTEELKKLKLTQQQINSVLESCERTEYTVALTKVFEFTHGNSTASGTDEQTHIAHPNLYFERSVQYEKKMKQQGATTEN